MAPVLATKDISLWQIPALKSCGKVGGGLACDVSRRLYFLSPENVGGAKEAAAKDKVVQFTAREVLRGSLVIDL